LKAQSIKTGKFVAIKCMKSHFNSLEQVNNLREIQALRRLSPHPHIVKLIEILYDEPTGRLALVFELMDLNLYEWTRGRRHYLPESSVKCYMFQLLKSIEHMHRNGIFHRDIKPENVLLMENSLKLADFGSCRGVYSKQPYTEYISTRWYRAPECLLTDGYYSFKMDIWGVGCIFFEVLALFPLFPGTNELDQINKIHNILGTPRPDLLMEFQGKASHMKLEFQPTSGTGIDELIPHVSREAKELIGLMLAYRSDDRLTAKQAIRHPYFKDLREQEKPTRTFSQSPANFLDLRSSLNGSEAVGEEPKESTKPSPLSKAQVLPPINDHVKRQSNFSEKMSESRLSKNTLSHSQLTKKASQKQVSLPYQKKSLHYL
jgi:renal tumor antigen